MKCLGFFFLTAYLVTGCQNANTVHKTPPQIKHQAQADTFVPATPPDQGDQKSKMAYKWMIQDIFNHTMKQHLKDFELCVETWTKDHPTSESSHQAMTLKLEVSKKGDILWAKIEDRNHKTPPSIGDCFLKVVWKMNFPQHPFSSITIEQNFNFTL